MPDAERVASSRDFVPVYRSRFESGERRETLPLEVSSGGIESERCGGCYIDGDVLYALRRETE